MLFHRLSAPKEAASTTTVCESATFIQLSLLGLVDKMVTLTVDHHFLAAYIFYGCILLAKMMLMSGWTARHRIPNKAFPSPEDYGPKNKDRPVPQHPDVERVRRAHRNDLESIPAFLLLALLYMLANLPTTRGIWCMRIFTAARIAHTLFYLNSVSSARAISFIVSMICVTVIFFSILLSGVKTGIY